MGDGITNATTLTLTGNATANSTVTVYDGTTQLGTATVDANGAWNFATGTLAKGSHSFTATDTLSGVTSAASTALAVTVDTVAPAVTETLAKDTGSSSTDLITSNNTLTGSGDPNAVVHFTVDGNAIAGTATANASGVWTFAPTGLADGSHTIVASETDAAGNIGTASLTFTLDTKVPVVAESLATDTGSSSSDKITANDTLTGTADPNAVVHFTVDGTAIAGTATADANGLWTFTPTVLADGSHTIVASEAEIAGNTGTASLTFTYDTTAPLVTDSFANGILTGSGDPNASVHFTLDGTPITGTATANASGAWSLTPTGLAIGSHTIVASETDAAGNTGSFSLDFTINPAPIASIADIVQNTTGNARHSTVTTTVSGTSDAGDVVTLYEGTKVLGTTAVNNSGQWSISLNNLSNTVHNFTAAATDAAGNTGALSQVAILGTTGGDKIAGVAGGDTIVGNGGADNFTAGAGNDTFVFNPHFGRDTVSNFDLNHDVLNFDPTLFANVANVLSHTHDVNGNAVITFDSADTVTLLGITTAQLSAHQNDIHII